MCSDLYDNENLSNLVSRHVYTLTEAATALGISYSAARKLIKQGRLKYFRLGKKILIPEEELRKLMGEGDNQKVRVRGES
jgi:excisionase family DNA binding protein